MRSVFFSAILVSLAVASSPSGAQTAPRAADWPGYNRTLTGERFSPLTQISAANVARLVPRCTYDTREVASFQTGPIVIDGRMYFTTDTLTYAIDAASCRLRWKQRTPFAPTGLGVSRGVAFENGRLFRGGGSGHAMALDAETGRLLWDVYLGDSVPGTSSPMAPVAWNGLLFIGKAGGDNHGVTGHVWALDQRDGRTVWRFDVIPEIGPARATWGNAPGDPPTGGAFWTTFALEPEQQVLYVPAGNPAPDFRPEVRPGDNLYTNCVIALDARTGALLGYIQLVRRDAHDWDVSAGPVVLTTWAGRAMIASANKDGLLSLIDRSRIRAGPPVPASGNALWWHSLELIRQVPVTTRENTDLQLTRFGPTRFCPGSQGGSEWNGPSYSPALNLLVVGAADWCFSVVLDSGVAVQPGAPWTGDESGGFGTPDPFSKARGWVTAVNPETGAVRWKRQTTLPLLAGVTTTAGGLVLTGELSGFAVALNARTGAVLWRHQTGNPIGGGIITYQVGSRQLVAVASGMKSPIWPGNVISSRIVVYGLP